MLASEEIRDKGLLTVLIPIPFLPGYHVFRHSFANGLFFRGQGT